MLDPASKPSLCGTQFLQIPVTHAKDAPFEENVSSLCPCESLCCMHAGARGCNSILFIIFTSVSFSQSISHLIPLIEYLLFCLEFVYTNKLYILACIYSINRCLPINCELHSPFVTLLQCPPTTVVP